MKIQLIRNATLRLEYGGITFLIDPFFADKGSLPSFRDIAPNPTVALPISIAEIMRDLDAILISHLHADHFDDAARKLLPRDLPVLCQPENEEFIHLKGYDRAIGIRDAVDFGKIRISRVPGRHGSSDAVLERMGSVSGFVFEADGEPTLYWAGDTVFYDEVAETLTQFEPNIVVTHSGGAVWGDSELIIMDEAQTIQVCQSAPGAVVIATHLESLDHCLTTREGLHRAAEAAGLSKDQLKIPADGEIIKV